VHQLDGAPDGAAPLRGTEDDSRNSFILAVITLGEGWHNNHHRYQGATRNGFYWWEIDITYYALRCLSWTGLIWGLKEVPKAVLEEGARLDHHESVAAASRAHVRHPEHAPLRRIVPAAAAIAVATVNAAYPAGPRRADAAIHSDPSGPAASPQGERTP
jgi:stearoyl-CoA desaturase (delta-9 desaturase)